MSVSINGTNGLTFNDASVQNTAATGFGFKNRIINGAMMIDQRNAGASVTPTTNNQYTIDRWSAGLSNTSKFSVQRSATAPAGFVNSLLVTSLASTSLAAGDFYDIRQNIEGFNTADLAWGTASAQTVTLSFWVRSSLTGTFGGALTNGTFARGYPFSYTIAAANTWEQKSITIAGDTTGTWATDNNTSIKIIFGLGVGSTYSGTAGAWAATGYESATGATSVVGTNGATFYITGVQLEKGSTATSFDYRPYGTELALCQRYYQKSSGAGGYKYLLEVGSGVNSIVIRANYPLKTSMRSAPTSVDYSNVAVDDNSGVIAVSSVAIFSASSDCVGLQMATAGGVTQFRPYFVTTNASAGYIGISAEL